MGDLGQLYFGRDDAESDIAEGGLLHAGFLRTAAFKAVESGKKQLIIGRKGAGKSAICVTLADMNEAVSLITPDEISADEIQRFELAGINVQQSKAIIWRYILAVQVAKFVVAHARAHDKAPGSVDALRKFLLANGEVDDHRWHEKFWRVIQRLRSSLSLEAFGAKVSLDAGVGPSDGIRASDQLEIVEKGVRQALADLKCDREHPRPLLLVDQIEKVWSNDQDSEAMVAGLLQAAKHVSATLPGVRCVVFLRADIYDILQFPDKDKLHGDEMRIDWKPEGLCDLALARASASLGRRTAATDLFGGLFPATVNGQDTRNYLAGRTLLRPRDMIQFCNLCRDTAEKNGHSTVAAEDVLEAEVQYSLWKLQDLANEYMVNYPFLGEIFVLFQNSGFLLSRKAIDERMGTLQRTLLRRYPDYADMISTARVIAILFGIGFLGVKRKHGFEYAYSTEKPVEAHENQFCIHPAFREALRATTAANIHPYTPSDGPASAMLPASISSAWLGPTGYVPRGYSDPDLDPLIEVVRTGDGILSRLAGADVPPELAEEIREQVIRMRDDAAGWLDRAGQEPGSVNPGAIRLHAKRAADYVARLAQDLQREAQSNESLTRLANLVGDSAERLHLGPLLELSPRERPVAQLAARGLSISEIASELRTSPRTVETMLSSIYAKLRVRSRPELQAALEQLL